MSQRLSAPVEGGRNYRKKCDAQALVLSEAHSQSSPLTLFAACFCPFVHRAWIALERSKLPYEYKEVDPYQKPDELLEVSPKGLVPSLKLNEYEPPRSVHESSVIVEYIDELALTRNQDYKSLLPADPYARAIIRLQLDHASKHVIPPFYKYLQAQEAEKQAAGRKEFVDGLKKLSELFEKASQQHIECGLWNSDEIGMVDIFIAPWLYRSNNVLKVYRAFQQPFDIPGYEKYFTRLITHPLVKTTASSDGLYLDSYARYAENRPNTSQVANAINSGTALP